jgi:hypothetical protein
MRSFISQSPTQDFARGLAQTIRTLPRLVSASSTSKSPSRPASAMPRDAKDSYGTWISSVGSHIDDMADSTYLCFVTQKCVVLTSRKPERAARTRER